MTGVGRLRLLLLALLGLCSIPAVAQTWTVSSITPNSPDLGTVVSGTGSTPFTIASSGVVTPASGTAGSGGAIRVTSGNTRPTITITCTGGSNSSKCPNGIVTVTVTATGSPTRAGALTAFTVAAGTGTPTNITGSGTGTLSFRLTGIPQGGNRTVYLGMQFPISAAGSNTGNATSSFSVTTGASPLTGTAIARVIRPLAVVNNSSLRFGILARPNAGSGSATIDAQTGARSVSGGVAAIAGSIGPAQFTLTGEGGQTVSITTTGSFPMTLSGAPNLTVTTSTWSASNLLSSSLGSAGTLSVFVGGTLSDITSSTPLGTYIGTFTVSAAYN